MSDQFEKFKDSLDGLKNNPIVTVDLFHRFNAENMGLLGEADLTPTQIAAISAELIKSPGAGTLEILAHSLIGSPYVPDLGIKLSEKTRIALATEADFAGEGMYELKTLLTYSDEELAKAYLDAVISYVRSQTGD